MLREKRAEELQDRLDDLLNHVPANGASNKDLKAAAAHFRQELLSILQDGSALSVAAAIEAIEDATLDRQQAGQQSAEGSSLETMLLQANGTYLTALTKAIDALEKDADLRAEYLALKKRLSSGKGMVGKELYRLAETLTSELEQIQQRLNEIIPEGQKAALKAVLQMVNTAQDASDRVRKRPVVGLSREEIEDLLEQANNEFRVGLERAAIVAIPELLEEEVSAPAAAEGEPGVPAPPPPAEDRPRDSTAHFL